MSAIDAIDERREFVADVAARDAVRRTDYSRDGYRTLFVEFEAGAAGFEEVAERARDLGFEYDRVAPRLYRFEVVERGGDAE